MATKKSSNKNVVSTKTTENNNNNKCKNHKNMMIFLFLLIGLNILLSLGILFTIGQSSNSKIDSISNKVDSIDNFFKSNVQGYGTTDNQASAKTEPTSDLDAITSNSNLYPSLGVDNSKHTVIEFIDFQCPFCGLASGLTPDGETYKSQYSDLFGISTKLEKLSKEGKIKYIVVPMSFLGQESVYAAQAGLCANKQGKFFEMHNSIFSAQTQGENSGKYSKANLEIIANNITGLDQTKFKNCLENDETLTDVKTIAGIASQFAQGTPTFYVDGNKIGASWTQINSIISN